MSSELAIPKGSTVLVTGVNGYIGSHVADQLLLAGYKVKGTVRSEDKGTIIAETFKNRHGGKDVFSYAVVEDMSTEGAFHDAMKGCSGVAHVAGDLTFRDDPNLVIKPVIAGVQNALKAAASTPTVKRFVLTSSSNALVVAAANTEYHLDQNSWNEISSKEAWKTKDYDPATRPMHVYSASKVESERAAWAFMEAEKPHFVLNTVCPNFNVGEMLDKRQAGSSAGFIKALWEGDPGMTSFLQNAPPQFFIDVKDDARLHVAALSMMDVKGERLLALSEPFNYSRWCESFKKIDPSRNMPPAPENEGKNISTVDMQRSIELLKRMGFAGLTPLDESVRQLIQSVS